jgi:hypothetical protein
LGEYNTAEERDAVVDQIIWVRYTNKSIGFTNVVTTAEKYVFLGGPTAEYTIWYGHQMHVIGDWEIAVLTRNGRYTGSFTITQDMVEYQMPALAAEDHLVIGPVDPEGFGRVLAWDTNGEDYRLRIKDDENNFVHQSRWMPPGFCLDPGIRCTMEFFYPAIYHGYTARIETRIYGQGWPTLFTSEGCQAYDMRAGAETRSLVWIKLEEPPPEPICDESTLGMERLCEVTTPPFGSCLGSKVCYYDFTTFTYQWTDCQGCGP